MNNKILAIEYALCHLIFWMNGINTFENSEKNNYAPSTDIFSKENLVKLNKFVLDFNINNNFSINQLIMLPFFLSTANGNREFMFKCLFDSFKANDTFIYQDDLKEELEKNDSNRLIVNSNIFKIHVNTNLLEERQLCKYFSQLNDELADYPDTTKNTDFLTQINRSLKAMSKNTIEIACFPEHIWAFLTRRHTSWSILQYNSNNYKEGAMLSVFKQENSMFSENEETMMYI